MMKRERKEERQERERTNLEIRLIRKINRWDLRNSDLYSCASVFDITLLAKPQITQQVHFHLRDGLQDIEKILMQMKWIQYPNPRFKPLAATCHYPKDHPIAFEPEVICDQARLKNQTCIPCLGMKKARSFINKAYAAQHKVCTDSESRELLQLGAELVLFLRQHKLYSIFSFKRRASNMRGSPARAAFGFCLLQELRLTTESKFNSGNRNAPQLLRDELQNLLAEYAVDNQNFMVRSVEPIMPVNPLWRRENGDGDKQEIGILIESHTVGCLPSMLHFGRIWWPLTSAHISRSLNVVLGVQVLNHVRISDERFRLNLHNPFLFLCPSICTRRTLGSHLI